MTWQEIGRMYCFLLVQQGKGQRRVTAVHVVDALFICDTDVRQLHYNERSVLLRVGHASTVYGVFKIQILNIKFFLYRKNNIMIYI